MFFHVFRENLGILQSKKTGTTFILLQSRAFLSLDPPINPMTSIMCVYHIILRDYRYTNLPANDEVCADLLAPHHIPTTAGYVTRKLGILHKLCVAERNLFAMKPVNTIDPAVVIKSVSRHI